MASVSAVDQVIYVGVVPTSTGFGVRKTWGRALTQPYTYQLFDFGQMLWFLLLHKIRRLGFSAYI